MLSPTQQWRAALLEGPEPICLPELSGPALAAEGLLLLLHYGVDWDNGWPAKRRKTYWDKGFPDRVVVATYRARTLRRWWAEASAELDSAPRTAAQRIEVAQLLEVEDQQAVLDLLRVEAEPLVLRVRIIADAVRDARGAPQEVSRA